MMVGESWFTSTGSNTGGLLNPYPSGGGISAPPGMTEALSEMGRRMREEADFEMDMKRKDLDLRVKALQQQGRTAEAAAENQRGQLELAKQRLAWEKEIQTKQFNLSRAQAQAQFLSGPDMMFMGQDFGNALQRAGLGVGPAPLVSFGSPRPRTVADFEASENGTWNGANSGTPIGGAAAYPTLGSGPAGDAQQAAASRGSSGGGTAQTDPRLTAVKAITNAIPPSTGGGTDANDQAALAAVESIYRASLPGTLNRMRPGEQKAFAAGLSRLGFYAPDVIAEMNRAAPGQGSPRRAA